MASRRVLALVTLRPRTCSQRLEGQMAAPKSLKLAVPFQQHPGKLAGPKRLRSGARRDDFGLVQVDREANSTDAFDQCREETMHCRGGACTEPIIKEEGADVETVRMVNQGDTPCLLNDWVDGQGKKNRAERVALLYSSGAGDRLVGTREESAVVSLTAVHPWRELREMCADSLQNR